MKIKTAQDYLKSLRKLDHKVYYKGKRIKDVTRHPATAPHVRAAAMTY
ncbi:MAG: 4-hydroxyphenylacetate 3-hydroxylase N-terminal domain-containing protein, partial [bacterium]